MKGKNLLIIAAVILVAYLVYKFVIKKRLEDDEPQGMSEAEAVELKNQQRAAAGIATSGLAGNIRDGLVQVSSPQNTMLTPV